MPKFNEKNERIKRAYLDYLENAKRYSPQTTDKVIAAIALFEASTNWKDFAKFHVAQATAFKRQQYEAISPKTGKPLAKATVHAQLMHLKAFFFWLADKPGYKSRISFSDCEYFNPSNNDGRIATAKREKRFPTLDEIRQAIDAMPDSLPWEKRDKAIMAFAILTGARDDAIASFALKHVDLANRKVDQDARDVRTKNRKSFTTWFFPVGDDMEAILADWIDYLKTDLGFRQNDPLFPATEMGLNDQGEFAPKGLSRNFWSNADPIRKAFKKAFSVADLPSFHPHSVRNTLVQLGEKTCASPEEFKAWSQNLGHEQVLTTFTSYGKVSSSRQAEIIANLGKPKAETSPLTPEAYAAFQAILDANKPR